MTIKEVLDYVDRIKKNDFTAAEKMRWINEIEGYVQVQIMLLAQPECISYYPVSESDMSGISFPASNQMLLPRKLKAHVGGLISIEGLVSYPNNNRPNLEILSISEGGRLIEFTEGTFADTGTTPESAIAQLTFDGQETELLVSAPFERLYYEYVLCKISENLEESSAQNNRIATFEETWENFAEWYANNYNPADGNAEFKGYYITGKQGPPGPTGPRGENIYTVTVTENSGVITADKAYAEIYAKVEAGKSVTLVVGGAVYAVNATKQDGLLILSTAVRTGGKPEITGYTVSSNNVWTAIKDDLALKSVFSSYRTAAAQDAIDATKQDKLTAGENITISADGKTISATGGDGGLGVFEVTLTSADGVLAADKTFEQVKAAVADGKPVLKVHSDGDVLWFFLLDKSPAEIDFVGFVDEQILAYLTAKQDGSWETTVTARVTAEMFSALSEKLGNLNNLTTTAKTSLVAAINELKSGAASFAPVATSGSYNDLTDKPTIPSVPTATIQANAAARHEHSNKTVLDIISETVKAAWDTASTWVTTNGANVLSHLSDSIKHINAAERTAWNGKQDKIIAGDNITIAADGKTISATGGGGGVSGEIETVEAQQIEIPSKLSDFDNDSGFTTSSAVEAALADKQDTISDLENIRSGAGKGATALQAVPTTYRTASAQDVIDNGLSDRVGAIEEKEAGWNGKYSKPTNGIPKTDLASAVQTSLGKADSALQAVPSTYRTASAQDSIDSGKVDKVTGKGLSTNDYTAAAKAKVDAIPASPKYTDTVYDDTAVKSRLSAVEGKLNGSGSASFASVETAALKATGEVEVYGAQPHIDFHYGNSSGDYTSRIIETESGKINIAAPNGVSINGTALAVESVTLTANTSRITNVSYTAKFLPLLGAVFVRIYGKINDTLNTGYDYDLFTIGSRLPNSVAALSVKCGKNAMANAKAASGSGAIQIRPLEAGINGYDVYITGFWFV